MQSVLILAIVSMSGSIIVLSVVIYVMLRLFMLSVDMLSGSMLFHCGDCRFLCYAEIIYA
jgi:hypothetical protein